MPPVMSTRRTAHQSFRLSRPGVLVGHRVKPHLVWLDTLTFWGKIIGLLALESIGLAACAWIIHATKSENHPILPDGSSEIGIIALAIVPWALIYAWFAFSDWALVRWGRPFLIWSGRLTPDEAEWYPINRWLDYRYRTRKRLPRLNWWETRTPWPLEWQERVPVSVED
jgi:hypothetical protein